MEYKIITPDSLKYPEKLQERSGSESPPGLYYYGPLEFLGHFTMAVMAADSISGLALMETNQLLFTIREYEMNYLGGWHSVMETEIFRLGLFRKNTTVTLFSAKGLNVESYDSFLLDRFYPPMHEFPERDEYFRRAKAGELLMLSITEPDETRQLRKNIMRRNWISCVLADIIFIPFGPKGSKTYTIAKKVIEANIPVFTIEHNECSDLHRLGIPGFNRKTVKDFLEERGVKPALMKGTEYTVLNNGTTEHKVPLVREPSQQEMEF